MPTAPTTADDLSLSELLHVLDVARTLRRDSEVVASELNKEELYATLKERLLASAAAAGDSVSEAEVDTAIRIYFENLHRYKDPPLSFSTLLAHAYIRRAWIAIGLLFCSVTVGSLWWLFWREGAALSSETRAQATASRAAELLSAATQRLEKQLTSSRSIAEEPAAIAALDQLAKEGAAAKSNRDPQAIDEVAERLAALETKLRDEYQVLIVSHPDRRTGIERHYEGKLSGYYLIVEARTADGEVRPREITDRERSETRRVTSWGEQVPQAVYDRIARDKQADGVVDEQPFAIKRRGRLDLEVQLPDPNGRPLQREGQITGWEE